MSEHFRCLPYSATMSRSSCGKRYREASCGARRTVAEWAGLLGVSPKVIHSRLSQGWDEARAVSAPHHARRVA